MIKGLEDELGSELFLRNGRGVIITEAGKILLGYAKEISDIHAKAIDHMRVLRQSPLGEVVVGLPPTVGASLTLPLLREVRATYPSISVRIVEGFSGFVLEWLMLGRLDLAITYNSTKTSTLQIEQLRSEELSLIGASTQAGPIGGTSIISLADVADLPLILPSGRHGLRMLIDAAFLKLDLSIKPLVQTDSLQSMLALAEDGIGYVILPEIVVIEQIHTGRLRSWQIRKPVLSRRVVLATSMSRTMTPSARRIAQIIRKLVSE